jgi:hypothetical protein
MIVAKVCPCGKGYRAEAWALLAFKGLQAGLGDAPLALRNCSRCGSTLALPIDEDLACLAIGKVSAAARLASFHARLALAMVRQERANAAFADHEPSKTAITSYLADAREQRFEAAFLRAELRRLEELLAQHWRAREIEDPKARIGRVLVALEGGANGNAKTEPPAAEAQ